MTLTLAWVVHAVSSHTLKVWGCECSLGLQVSLWFDRTVNRAKAMRNAIVLIAVPLCSCSPSTLRLGDPGPPKPPHRSHVHHVPSNRSLRSKSVLRPNREENPEWPT